MGSQRSHKQDNASRASSRSRSRSDPKNDLEPLQRAAENMAGLTATELRYLETIYSLLLDAEVVKTSELARVMDVAAPSATEMVQKLARRGYADYTPYHGVRLTAEGEALALRLKRKHRLLERFLHGVLDIPLDRVHEQALKLEYGLSDEAEDALCQLLGHPDKCPDDYQPIPPSPRSSLCRLIAQERSAVDEAACKRRSEGGGAQPRGLPLTGLNIGAQATIDFIRGGRKASQRLADMGLTPGTEIEVVNIAPFGGPIEILVRESRLVLGRGLANKVFIHPS